MRICCRCWNSLSQEARNALEKTGIIYDACELCDKECACWKVEEKFFSAFMNSEMDDVVLRNDYAIGLIS